MVVGHPINKVPSHESRSICTGYLVERSGGNSERCLIGTANAHFNAAWSADGEGGTIREQ